MHAEALTLLPHVLRIAREAGEKILAVYATPFAVQTKSDNSPLTAADVAAHDHILAKLDALEHDLPCLSEEGGDIDFATRRSWESYWLIDPLDGTREFVQRTGEFTVNIALIHRGEPILGVVHAPALEVSYFAARGAGAWRQSGDSPFDALQTARNPTTLRILASRNHRSERDAALLDRIPNHIAITAGSALKFGRIAEGAADLYPRLGPTSEWDTAAGQCVVEQAGGAVLGPDLKPLHYNSKDSLLNPDFYAIGDLHHPWKPLLIG